MMNTIKKTKVLEYIWTLGIVVKEKKRMHLTTSKLNISLSKKRYIGSKLGGRLRSYL